jgi:hypothetical protein
MRAMALVVGLGYTKGVCLSCFGSVGLGCCVGGFGGFEWGVTGEVVVVVPLEGGGNGARAKGEEKEMVVQIHTRAR